MSKTYTDREIEDIFDRIWKWWPNKDKEAASRKALAVAVRQGADPKGIELACRIYALDHGHDEFRYQLNNFIMKDEWIDLLEGCKNPQEYYAKLEEEDNLARSVITHWNNSCRDHWHKVISINDRVAIVKNALKNEFFRKHWKISLDKLVNIFKYRPREDDPKSKINITLKWFCNVSPDKHTVLKIEEGEYGAGALEINEKVPQPHRKMTDDERAEAIADFEEVFGRPITRTKKDEPRIENKSGADSEIRSQVDSVWERFFD